jgi:hypothetical protein
MKTSLFILRHPNEDYQISSLVKYNFMLFENKNIQKIFYDNGINIITLNNPLLSKFVNQSKFKFDFKSFSKYINQNNDNIILFTIGPYPWIPILKKINKKNNVKIIAWQDDPHVLARNLINGGRKKIHKFIISHYENYNSNELNNFDHLITPSSCYFYNLKMEQYYHKITNIFYTLNENWYPIIDTYTPFCERKNKILLSGKIARMYDKRIEFKNLSEQENFKNIIDIFIYPFLREENSVALNYYKNLCMYKGAFVSTANKPIDYLLAKHIEVLMCGCIGFFDESPLLKKELGLIAFEHYVPCTIDDELIQEPFFYKKYLNTELGEKIANNGRDFVRKKFGNKNINNYIDFFKSLSFTV